MTPFDILFLLAFAATAGSLVVSAVLLVRGQRARARSGLRRTVVGVLIYMAIVTVFSIVSARGVASIGEEQCSDDWCISVVQMARAIEDTTATVAEASNVVVTFRLHSRARRAPQRERFVVAYMLDAVGRRYDARPFDGALPFDTILAPGESVETRREFTIADSAERLGVVVAREGDYAIPRCCIIGQGPFYKFPIVYMR